MHEVSTAMCCVHGIKSIQCAAHQLYYILENAVSNTNYDWLKFGEKTHLMISVGISWDIFARNTVTLWLGNQLKQAVSRTCLSARGPRLQIALKLDFHIACSPADDTQVSIVFFKEVYKRRADSRGSQCQT